MSNAPVTPAQVKADRHILGLWQSDLAEMVGVSEKSIRDFESGALFATSLDLDLVREALESRSVQFIVIGSNAPAVSFHEVTKRPSDRKRDSIGLIKRASGRRSK
jgi:predicted transcriptional regulator